MQRKVRILSLDGGGIRGLISARIMEYVEQQLQLKTGNPDARLADYFDFITGTSTGAILAAFYLCPNPDKDGGASTRFTASDAATFYEELGYSIFNASKRKKWLGVRQLFNATQYKPDALEAHLSKTFGDIKLGELIKPCLMPVYSLTDKKPVLLGNALAETNEQYYKVKDVLRATTAAPTYFPPAHIKNDKTGKEMIVIDGGVYANNPSMCAYAECRRLTINGIKAPKAKDMLVLSIGTGGGNYEMKDVNKSWCWSVIDWARAIPEIMMDGDIDVIDYQMYQMFETLGGEDATNYKRIDVPANARNYRRGIADARRENLVALNNAAQKTIEGAVEARADHLGLDIFIDKLIEQGT